MSVSSRGPKGSPEFESTGNPPTFAADLEAVADYAAIVGNRVRGTAAQRSAFEPDGSSDFADGPWEGLRWYETDTDIEYLYDGSAWKAWESDWFSYTPTLTNITIGSGGTVTGKYRYGGGDLFGQVLLTGGTGFAFTGDPKFSVPVTMPATSFARSRPGELTLRDVSIPNSKRGILMQLSADTTALTLGYLVGNVETPGAEVTVAAGDVFDANFWIPLS